MFRGFLLYLHIVEKLGAIFVENANCMYGKNRVYYYM